MSKIVNGHPGNAIIYLDLSCQGYPNIYFDSSLFSHIFDERLMKIGGMISVIFDILSFYPM